MKLTPKSFLYTYLKISGVISKWDSRIDTCQIFWGCLWTTLLIALFVAAFSCLITGPLIMLWTWLTMGYFDFNWTLGGCGIMFDGIIAAGTTIWFVMKWFINREPTQEKEPGVLAQTYRSWKEKTCTFVEIVHE